MSSMMSCGISMQSVDLPGNLISFPFRKDKGQTAIGLIMLENVSHG